MAREHISPELGQFLKPEQYYSAPGQFETALTGEALKRARYLAMMDQFYGELDENARQFDETMGFKRDELDWRMSLEEQAEERRDEIQNWEEEKFGLEMDWEQDKFSRLLQHEMAKLPTREIGGPSEQDMLDWYAKQMGGGRGRDPNEPYGLEITNTIQEDAMYGRKKKPSSTTNSGLSSGLFAKVPGLGAETIM